MSNIPLNIDFQQVLLHFLNVVILFFIIYFLLYKPVKNFMDKRRKEYEDMDSAAQEKLKEAEALKADYESRITHAEEEIRAMQADASEAMAARNIESEQQAREQASRILEQARAQAENEREKILESTSDKVTEMAREAASKVVFDNPSDAYDSFLNAVNGKDE